MLKRRYPGVSPFTSKQKNVFFGRDDDIKKLQKLISLRSQVLLYSKSGIGKTSLLNAGVLPIFEKDFTIIKIRFFAYNDKNSETPLEKIINTIKSQTNFSKKTTILDEITKTTNYEKSLWYYLKQLQLTSENEQKYILAFDQFEELFSYPEEQIIKFKEQFHELTKIDIPDNIMQFIAINENISEDIDLLYDDIKIKTVFAIRSDRLSLLNQLTDKLPDIQEIFYELKPLDKEQAIQAIINPAKDENDFETSPFEYEKQAIENIINALSANQKQNIETTQLQIVCQRIEEIAQKKTNNTLKNEIVKISNKDLPEFKDIFFNFYESAVKQTEQQAKTRKFIEDQLIRNNQRISLDEIICKDFVTEKTLKELTNTHLLRAEKNSIDGFSYELSHDTLVEPILISRKERKEKEKKKIEKQKEQIEQLAEQEKLIQKTKRKQQRIIITIVSISAIISLFFAVFGFINMQKAQEQMLFAQENEKKILELTTNYTIRDAYLYFQQQEYNVALQKYIYLRDTLLQGETTIAINERIEECQLLIEQKQIFDSLMMEAQLSRNQQNYNLTIEFYYKALEINLNNEIVISNFKDLLIIIQNLQREYIQLSQALSYNANQSRQYELKATKLIMLERQIKKILNID